MPLSKDIDLLLIGKTGFGKSALGNSILRHKAFESKSSTSSVTNKISCEVSVYKGRKIKVVDGPGLADTTMGNEQVAHLVVNAMEDAIAINPRGYHAFLLVAKYGGRFSCEDQNVVIFLKQIFGESFVKDFCILVLTCGDLFQEENPIKSFEIWCEEQVGVFKNLIKECNGRIILFDNRTKDSAERNKQIDALIDMVDDLRWREKRYTNHLFKEAQEAQEKIMIEARIPIIEDEVLIETSLILQEIECIRIESDTKRIKRSFKKLKVRAAQLYERINKADKRTGVLKKILDTVGDIQVVIENEMCIVDKFKMEKKKISQKAESNKIKLMEESRRLNEKYDKLIKQNSADDKRQKELLRKRETKMQKLEEKLNTQLKERVEKIKQEEENERKKQKKITDEIEKKYRFIRDAD